MRRGAVIAAVTAAALLSALLLAEGGLWLAQRLALMARDSATAPAAGAKGKRVLALGDSWTYGMESGDPASRSYPAQLQTVMDDKLGKGRYQVVNRGKPGLTSRHLAASLSAQLAELDPEMVLVMVGPANFFQTVGVTTARGFWGPLEGSRVLATLRLLFSPVGSHFSPPSPAPVKDALAKAVQEGPADAGERLPRGTPAPGTTGCTTEHKFRPLEPRLDAAMGQPPKEMVKVLGAGAGCVKLLTLSAEFCLERGKADRALHFARKALALAPMDPRAKVAIARALLSKGKNRTVDLQSMLRQVVITYPGYTRAWRQLTLVELALEPTLCSVRSNVISAKAACPSCKWVKAAAAILERDVAGPGRQALEADLNHIAQRCRLAKARLLLINFPPVGGDPCSDLARQTVAAVAAGRGLPVLDIEEVLGDLPALKADRPVHYGEDHPNAQGYRLMAEAVHKKLKGLGWIK